MSNYQLVNGIAVFAVLTYGLIDRFASGREKYSSFEIGIFNLVYVFSVFS